MLNEHNLTEVFGSKGLSDHYKESAAIYYLVFGVIWSLISCRGAVASVGYHLDRGLEIESIYSGAVLGLTSMTGTRPTVRYSSGPRLPESLRF